MNFLNGRCWFWWKMVFVKTLIHLKTPSPLFWVQFIEPWEGCPTAILSLSIGMYILFILCLYMHCLILVINYVYVSANCSMGKGNSAILFYICLRWKRKCVLTGKARGRGKSNTAKLIVKTYSGFNRLDADQGDQLIEQLRRCGASIPLLSGREGLCYHFFEISSASCYVQA